MVLSIMPGVIPEKKIKNQLQHRNRRGIRQAD